MRPIMRTFARLLVVCSGLLGCVVSAWSQTNTDTYFFTPGGGGVNGAMAMCLNGTNPATARAVPCSDPSALPSPVSGTFSASLAGFTPNGNFGTLTATAASSGSTALPGGAVVAFQNTSTIDLSCVLSAGAATATTNKIVIRGGSSVFLTVGSNINAACINQTGSASNVVVMAGGTGLGTNFGGGGAGGGGGAITAASGSYAAGSIASGAMVDFGAQADAVCGSSAGSCSLVALIKFLNNAATAATPACSAAPCATTIGNVGIDPTSGKATPAFINLALPATTTTQIIALSGSTKTYITSLKMMASGAVNLTLKYGTGSNCGTGTNTLEGPYPLAAQAGVAAGAGTGAVIIVPAAQAVCVTTDASVSGFVSMTYQQF
jgi:hypothetical protein